MRLSLPLLVLVLTTRLLVARLGAGPAGSKWPAFTESVGGSWGVAVVDRPRSSYSNLLFLAYLSGSETAVVCRRWNGKTYAERCSDPRVDVLSHPQPE